MRLLRMPKPGHYEGEGFEDVDAVDAAARAVAPEPRLPELGPGGWVRWIWRQITSMRTALVLLLLVALAAIPGSIFPQRSLDPGRVADYLRDHPDWGAWLDRLGFFDVFASPWFSAIYLLLMVSLIGCVIPRTAIHARALRTPPPRAPQRLDRLAERGEAVVVGDVAEVTMRARAALGRTYRVRPDAPAGEISAESGYLRETGNLLFHVALMVVIAALAWGHLVGWRADRIVPEGQSFTNTVASYDTFNPGPWVDPDRLTPFQVRLDSLDVRFESNPQAGRNVGAPRDFRARTTVTPEPGAPAEQREFSVNGPLGFGATQVYLLGNGYAPRLVVRDAAGAVLFRQQVPFLPRDGVYTSTGAVKVTAAQPKQLGFSGVLLPTATGDGQGGLTSSYPGLSNPALVLEAYEGELFPGARPQSVYTLDTARMERVRDDAGQPLQLTLAPGQTATLPGGRGTVTFEGVDRWAGVSARYDPARPVALAGGLLATVGLALSLLVRRRRAFVRVAEAAPAADGTPRSHVVAAFLPRGEDVLIEGAAERFLARLGAQDGPAAHRQEPGAGPAEAEH